MLTVKAFLKNITRVLDVESVNEEIKLIPVFSYNYF
jgi:hypothetical protein